MYIHIYIFFCLYIYTYIFVYFYIFIFLGIYICLKRLQALCGCGNCNVQIRLCRQHFVFEHLPCLQDLWCEHSEESCSLVRTPWTYSLVHPENGFWRKHPSIRWLTLTCEPSIYIYIYIYAYMFIILHIWLYMCIYMN